MWKCMQISCMVFFAGFIEMGFAAEKSIESVKDQNLVRFAVIGDYGTKSPSTKAVATMVREWKPNLIVTTGDNNYHWDKEPDAIDVLYNPFDHSEYDPPAVPIESFWPCLGNHDMDKRGNAEHYFSYFKTLNNQHYYEFTQASVHFFSLCSNKQCDHGIDTESVQAKWVETQLCQSKSLWKIVYYHHPTYSSRVRSPGGGPWSPEYFEKNQERRIDLPFSKWGVTAVFSGHLHLYERFDINGLPYITNGLGGDEKYTFEDDTPAPESSFRFAEEDGVMLVEANELTLSIKFITTTQRVIDHIILTH